MERAENDFKEAAHQRLDERQPGGEWKNYGFDKLLSTLTVALHCEGLSEECMTYRTGRILNAVETERARMKRIDIWNERQKSKNK